LIRPNFKESTKDNIKRRLRYFARSYFDLIMPEYNQNIEFKSTTVFVHKKQEMEKKETEGENIQLSFHSQEAQTPRVNGGKVSLYNSMRSSSIRKMN
jgi:hypothetical protein